MSESATIITLIRLIASALADGRLTFEEVVTILRAVIR